MFCNHQYNGNRVSRAFSSISQSNPHSLSYLGHFASAIETTPRVLNDTVDAGSSFHAFEDWSHSLDIGEISLSKEDISRMPVSMAAHYANKEEPSGELEVFHQLHCLVSLIP